MGAPLFDISKCFDPTNNTILSKKLEMNYSTTTLDDLTNLSNFTRKHFNIVLFLNR